MVEKFLMGRDKSQLWQSYGHVYRIWSGTRPEMYSHQDKGLGKTTNEKESLPHQKTFAAFMQTPNATSRLNLAMVDGTFISCLEIASG